MKNSIVTVISALCVLAAAGAGLYVFVFKEEANILPSISKSAEDKTLPSPTTPKQEQSLQVQGVQGAPSQDSTLPSPDEFDVYESYADAASPLYIDLSAGAGAAAVSQDKVAMLYSGYLTDGTLFDQTTANENNELIPFVFTLGAGEVISGWDQAIAGMKIGGQRRLIIPSAFGYGSTGQGPIPPNAMLIFDVQLVAINGKTQ